MSISEASEPSRKSLRQKFAERQQASADKRYIKKEINRLNHERQIPAFVVLEGVDPASNEPPPYRNVFLMRQAATRQIAEP